MHPPMEGRARAYVRILMEAHTILSDPNDSPPAFVNEASHARKEDLFELCKGLMDGDFEFVRDDDPSLLDEYPSHDVGLTASDKEIFEQIVADNEDFPMSSAHAVIIAELTRALVKARGGGDQASSNHRAPSLS